MGGISMADFAKNQHFRPFIPLREPAGVESDGQEEP